MREISEEEKSEIKILSEIRSEVDKIKEKASDEHKKGMFEKAIEVYESALWVVEVRSKAIKIRSGEVLAIKAALWNNISLGYKQMQNSDGEIEYASRVINSIVELESQGMISVVLKALLRWGYCYEREEKVKRAKEDFELILKYSPHDLEAKKALKRV